MRRFVEQIIVDAAEVAGMLLEGLLWGLPAALLEIADVLTPYTTELIVMGIIIWMLIW